MACLAGGIGREHLEGRVKGALHMGVTGIAIRSLGPVAATEIAGIDLAQPLDEPTFAKIEAAFDRSGVIVVRDQKITPAQQIAFAQRFGEIELNYHSDKYGLSEQREIYRISNITKDGKPIGSRRAGE